MKPSPRVTFIIPAYNAERYLPEAIESILAQTCEEWRLIIVDDCSSDDTLRIAEGYAGHDPRIRVMRMESQSGGAFIPRKVAIMAATTPFVSPLDADDTIPPDYLQRLLQTVDKEDADAAYPMMYSLRKGKYEFTNMPDLSLIGKTMTGREAATATLDVWRIHCNGGVIRRDAYLRAFGLLDEKRIRVKSYLDEYLTRLLLFSCRKVAITDARYFFRENPESITHSMDLKAFGGVENNLQLLSFVKANYPDNSEAYLRVNRQTFHGIADALRLLNKARLSREERRWVIGKLQASRNAIDHDALKGEVSRKYKTLLSLPFSLSVPLIRLIDSLHS